MNSPSRSPNRRATGMRAGAALALLFAFAVSAWAQPLPIEDFLKSPLFLNMKISPDGRYLAATVPRDGDKTIMTVIDRQSMKVSATAGFAGKEHVHEFFWVNDQRLLVTVARKEGMLDQPVPTGELYAMNADGSGMTQLFGYRMGGSTGARTARGAEMASAYPLDMMPDADNQVLIIVEPWGSAEGGYREARRMDVMSGRTSRVARSVLRRGDFLVDRQGNVRLTWGLTSQHLQQVHHRPASGGEWQLLHDETEKGFAMWPLAFDPDGEHILVGRTHAQGSGSIQRMNLQTGAMTEVYRHAYADPAGLLWGREHNHLYGVVLYPGYPDLGIVDEDSAEARLARSIRAAFDGQHARITSFTRDGKLALVHVSGDRNPGEFYLFEVESMRAGYLAGAREWLEPERLGEMEPVSLTARDGTQLHGYLQLPPGGEGRSFPLVMNPHGGPHGIHDTWGFDQEAQLLASRGYAVLKINFRGSGGYGRAFEHAGYREWGGKMQDDIADAVRWAIEQGYADPNRVCIYGASYGGYSALMSAVRYPELYQCTIGYVGVYDLDLMYRDGDIRESLYGRNYLERVLGRGDDLARFSPVTFAEQIKMPVFLIHGGEDKRVPISHANRLRSALRAAGNEPKWLVERREGHGFYNLANNVKLYTQLLEFLDEHIGSAAADRRAGAADRESSAP